MYYTSYDVFFSHLMYTNLIAPCGAGWELRPGTNDCFRFDETAKTWDQAKDACVSYGGALATIYNDDEQNYLTGK